jgi:hypothetical protein
VPPQVFAIVYNGVQRIFSEQALPPGGRYALPISFPWALVFYITQMVDGVVSAVRAVLAAPQYNNRSVKGSHEHRHHTI